MNQKYLAIGAIVFIVWFSWFFRYDLGSHTVVLDRWTGSIIIRDAIRDAPKAARPSI